MMIREPAQRVYSAYQFYKYILDWNVDSLPKVHLDVWCKRLLAGPYG